MAPAPPVPALPVLEMQGLRRGFAGPEGRVEVLRGVDLQLAAGETLALTGESGSGKSTLLHLIAGLDHADGGRIAVAGTEVTALDDAGRARLRREVVAVVFQRLNLVPALDVAANIALHARLAGRHEPALAARIAQAMGIGRLLRAMPDTLSGGQEQRVAIARALAMRPRLLLADEPTGNLDEATADTVLELMLAQVRASGAALLMVTHSQRLAARLDRHLHLEGGVLR